VFTSQVNNITANTSAHKCSKFLPNYASGLWQQGYTCSLAKPAVCK